MPRLSSSPLCPRSALLIQQPANREGSIASHDADITSLFDALDSADARLESRQKTIKEHNTTLQAAHPGTVDDDVHPLRNTATVTLAKRGDPDDLILDDQTPTRSKARWLSTPAVSTAKTCDSDRASPPGSTHDVPSTELRSLCGRPRSAGR